MMNKDEMKEEKVLAEVIIKVDLSGDNLSSLYPGPRVQSSLKKCKVYSTTDENAKTMHILVEDPSNPANTLEITFQKEAE